jgi:hypothetical protein
MIDFSCPVCQARYESVTNEHDERLMALREDYALRLAALRDEHDAAVMRQAEWRREQLEIVERLHAEHAGEGDGL